LQPSALFVGRNPDRHLYAHYQGCAFIQLHMVYSTSYKCRNTSESSRSLVHCMWVEIRVGSYMPIIRIAVLYSCMWCSALGIRVVILGSLREAFFTMGRNPSRHLYAHHQECGFIQLHVLYCSTYNCRYPGQSSRRIQHCLWVEIRVGISMPIIRSAVVYSRIGVLH
jgi:hypothetical protein